MEEFRAELIGGAIRAIEKDAETGELGTVNDAAAEKFEIFGVDRGIGDEGRQIFRRGIAPMFKNVGFKFFFDGIRKLHASVREKLYAVVVIGIVGRGNNDAGLKIILADETGDAGRGDDAGKSDGAAGLREACGE